MLVSLLNHVKGYLEIEVEGFFLERFINIIIRKQIYVWDIKKISATKMQCKISVQGFKLLRPIARKTRSQVRIKHRKGVKFTIYKHRKRRIFWLGAVLFCCILVTFCSCIWVIEIPETKVADSQKLIEVLADCGIRQGRFKYNIDPKAIQHKLLMEIPELTWAWVDIRGTKAILSINEVIKTPPVIPLDQPCNIVASKDGVITRMIVKRGVAVVKQGDVVRQGMLLVSGAVDSNVDGQRTVHAEAEIMANTTYTQQAVFPQSRTDFSKTNNKTGRLTLIVNNFPIKLFWGDTAPYSEFEREENLGDFGLFDYRLPIHYKWEQYYELNKTVTQLNEYEAAKYAKDTLLQQQLEQLPQDVQFISQEFSYIVDQDNNIAAESTLLCSEQIAVTREFEVVE